VPVAAADRVGEEREGNRSESTEAGQNLPLFRRGRPLFLLNSLKGADGGEDVAGLRLVAGGGGGEGGWPPPPRLAGGGGGAGGGVSGRGRSSGSDSWALAIAASPSPGVSGPDGA